MNMTKLVPALVAALAPMTLVVALAQTTTAQKPQLTLESYLVRTEVKDGKSVEVFEKASGVKPGQVMEYRVRAANPSDRAVTNISLDLPIPRTTSYLENSATLSKDANLLASWDFKRSFGATPLKRKVTRDGKTVEELVPANEYTNLRWVIRTPLAAGASFEFKARVKIR
jgi:uncharacterized repeat protein (TIGR01451 family)